MEKSNTLVFWILVSDQIEDYMLIIWHIISLCTIEEYQLLICYSEVRSQKQGQRGADPIPITSALWWWWEMVWFDFWLASLGLYSFVWTNMSHIVHQQHEYLQSKAHMCICACHTEHSDDQRSCLKVKVNGAWGMGEESYRVGQMSLVYFWTVFYHTLHVVHDILNISVWLAAWAEPTEIVANMEHRHHVTLSAQITQGKGKVKVKGKKNEKYWIISLRCLLAFGAMSQIVLPWWFELSVYILTSWYSCHVCFKLQYINETYIWPCDSDL